MTEQLSTTHVILLALTAVVFLVSFWRPWWALVAWVSALSIQLPYGFISDFRPAVSDAFVIPLLAGVILHKRQRGTKPGPARLSTLLWVFSAFFLLVGNAVAYIHLGTLTKWTLLNKDAGLVVLMACYVIVVYLLADRQSLNRIVEVFVVSGSALNLFALFGGVSRYASGAASDMMRETTGSRLVGFMVNPSSYGGYLACVALVQFALLLGGSRIIRLPRWLQWTNLFLLGLAISMTLARSAYLGLIAGIFGVLMFHRGRAALRMIVVSSLVMVVLVGILSAYASSDASQTFSIQVRNLNTVEQRIDTFGLAWDTFMDSSTNFVAGIGVGTFYEMQSNGLVPLLIHNTYLWILVELGPIGLCLLIAVLYRVLRDAYVVARAKLPESDIAVGVICAMVSVLIWFAGTEGLWHRHVWFLFALSQACFQIYWREKKAPVPVVPQRALRARIPAMSQ